ncbi:TIR-like protein FxsC [Mangrovihabitans endophyticus]|uniref:TIR domain-containing protein n=1 Tax=Mangrovihabitans endophyticus TaxID=1751298 RepID=A0A8J3BS32_9ACTN|nr:TIR-like protein FxsC [Mangrovihabitans endophyticus]GGK72252.1 hypothetical protein GCM10012284_02570 [Mangrovihabitans endophyticus]
MTPRPSDNSPLFFISYAHDGSADDEHVATFFHDLHHDVLMFAGRRRDQVAGFCDVVLNLGERWSTELIDNLSRAQVFIPLLSPPLFNSEACGKEWAVFAARLQASGRARTRESSIIPLLWVDTRIPPVAEPFQYREAAFGPTYEHVKLRALIRDGRHHDDYLEFVEKLARRIVVLSEGLPVAEALDRPGFHEVRSAFDDAPQNWRPATGRHGTAARNDQAGPPWPAARRTTPRPRSQRRPILNTNLPPELPEDLR